MNNFKSHFLFDSHQRSGIFFLVLLIIGLSSVSFFVDFSEPSEFDISSEEIKALTQELDSLHEEKLKKKKPKVFPFNPNFITDYKGYMLGMSSEEIDRLLKYRDKNQWINSVSDFKKVTKVSDSVLNKISPLFKFPAWVTNPKSKKSFKNNGLKKKSFHQKIDLNLATLTQLQEIYGIGKALANRIVSYRNKINGYTVDAQLYQVYGLSNEVVSRVLNEFTVKTPNEIIKINVNNASASDIATIPGISFDIAKNIWEFRILNEQIRSIEELNKIEGITKRKLELIKLYLLVE
ncbi:MAG: competence protein ComEA [Flavobacteriaceae bacterium]|jgi:competence protein ComEA|uniref:ComEA family DNA-binding protein n=1 Tax=Candidatus Marifrigoribacter sp. Uisw_064 TaxID=3230970 RepID=UPI003ADEECEA